MKHQKYSFEVNANGDSADTLKKGFKDTWVLLRTAMHALEKLKPDGRNYQTTDSSNYINDRALHSADLQALRDIQQRMTDAAVRASDSKKT